MFEGDGIGNGRSPSLSVLPTPFSLPLCLCQAVSTLHFSKSFPTNGKVAAVPFLAGMFFWLSPYSIVCSFTPFSLCVAWEKVVRLCHIRGHHFYDGTFRPFSLRLGISSPQASLTGQGFPFKDVAPFLYSLPSFFLSESPPEGERQQAIR